ncbi:MAG: PD40 domain-containing protein [Planctomycetes bacterium]|nr:PD40 domain-containing protein [Planctomycetota bacterium]
MTALDTFASLRKSCSLAISLGLCLGVSSVADDSKPTPPAAKINYTQQIEPIFRQHCQGCHQPAKPEGGLSMTNPNIMLEKGGDSGISIVRGKADESHLIAEITPRDGKAEMPKGAPPLSDGDIDLIRRWINEGASTEDWKESGVTYSAEQPPPYKSSPAITAVSYSPDGKWLAVSGFHEVILVDVANYTLARRFIGRSERIEDIAFSNDSTKLAVAGGIPGVMGELQLWNTDSGELIRSWNVGSDTLYGVAWSPDNQLISIGCADNSVRAFEVESGKQKVFSATHEDWALDTVFSLKGDHLLSVSRDRSMKLVHVDTQRFVDNVTSITPGAQKGGLMTIDRHPSREEVACGGADSVPKIYKIFRDKQRQIGDDFNLIRPLPAMEGRVFEVQYNRDGSKLAAVSSNHQSGKISVFQPDEGKELYSLAVPNTGAFSVAFAADGNTIAAGLSNGQLLVIDLTTSQVARTINFVDWVGTRP